MQERIKIIEEFLNKLGIDSVTIDKKESSLPAHSRYVIDTPDAAILIGNRGETLGALSHILKKVLEKNIQQDDADKFFIDIGEYQDKKVQDIKNRATVLAERARFFKKNIEMPPMGAYERMIVHSIFTELDDIETESLGRDAERRVVIKYIGS